MQDSPTSTTNTKFPNSKWHRNLVAEISVLINSALHGKKERLNERANIDPISAMYVERKSPVATKQTKFLEMLIRSISEPL